MHVIVHACACACVCVYWSGVLYPALQCSESILNLIEFLCCISSIPAGGEPSTDARVDQYIQAKRVVVGW